MPAVAVVVVAPESPVDDDVLDGFEQARNLGLLLISFVLVASGVFLYAEFRRYDGFPTFTQSTKKENGTSVSVLTPDHEKGLQASLPDLGLTLFSIGSVGVAYEWVNRKANERFLKRTVLSLSARLGETLGETLTRAVLGDTEFVQKILTDRQRGKVLSTLILANVASEESSAKELANSTALAFAGNAKLERFDVEYVIEEIDAGPIGKTYVARYRHSFTSNVRPNDLFRFHFEVVERIRDAEARVPVDPDVFYWRYWRDNDEERDAAAVLATMKVDLVKVNGVELAAVDASQLSDAERGETRADRHESWTYLRYEHDGAETFDFETRLTIPVSRVGAILYVQPARLAKGIYASCSYPPDAFVAAPTETLGCTHVNVHSISGQVVVRTGDWVAPSASIAFVLFPKSVREQQSPGKQVDAASN